MFLFYSQLFVNTLVSMEIKHRKLLRLNCIIINNNNNNSNNDNNNICMIIMIMIIMIIYDINN